MQEDEAEGEDEVEEEPDVHGLDVGVLRHHGREEDVQGGEDRHASNVRRHDCLEEFVPVDVHRGLVDYVHHDGGQVCGDQKTVYPPLQIDTDEDTFYDRVFPFLHSHLPHLVLQEVTISIP